MCCRARGMFVSTETNETNDLRQQLIWNQINDRQAFQLLPTSADHHHLHVFTSQQLIIVIALTLFNISCSPGAAPAKISNNF